MNQPAYPPAELKHQERLKCCHYLIAQIAKRSGGTKLLRGILPTLDGSLRPVAGVLPIAAAAQNLFAWKRFGSLKVAGEARGAIAYWRGSSNKEGC